MPCSIIVGRLAWTTTARRLVISNDPCPSRTASRMSYGRLPPDQGRSDGEAASITALAKFLSQVI